MNPIAIAIAIAVAGLVWSASNAHAADDAPTFQTFTTVTVTGSKLSGSMAYKKLYDIINSAEEAKTKYGTDAITTLRLLSVGKPDISAGEVKLFLVDGDSETELVVEPDRRFDLPSMSKQTEHAQLVATGAQLVVDVSIRTPNVPASQ